MRRSNIHIVLAAILGIMPLGYMTFYSDESAMAPIEDIQQLANVMTPEEMPVEEAPSEGSSDYSSIDGSVSAEDSVLLSDNDTTYDAVTIIEPPSLPPPQEIQNIKSFEVMSGSAAPERDALSVVERWMGVIGTINTLIFMWRAAVLRRKEAGDAPPTGDTPKNTMGLIARIMDWILFYINKNAQAKLRMRNDPDWNLKEFSQGFMSYPDPEVSLVDGVQVLYRTNADAFPQDIEDEMNAEGLEVITVNPLHMVRGKLKHDVPEELKYSTLITGKFRINTESWGKASLFDNLNDVVKETQHDCDAIILGVHYGKMLDEEMSTITIRFNRENQPIPHTYEEWETFLSACRQQFEQLQEDYRLDYVIVMYGVTANDK